LSLSDDLKAWNITTAELPWGVQSVMRDTLELVSSGDVTMIYAADYKQGSPCLVNAVGQLLNVGGGHGIPSAHFGPLVHLFDRINRHFEKIPGYNDPISKQMSPNTAEVLLRNFAPLKEKPIGEAVDDATAMEAFANNIYTEPKDADFMRDWLNSLEAEAQAEPAVGEVKAEQPEYYYGGKTYGGDS